MGENLSLYKKKIKFNKWVILMYVSFCVLGPHLCHITCVFHAIHWVVWKGGGVIMWVIVIFYYKCTSKMEHIEVAHSLIMFISNLICILQYNINNVIISTTVQWALVYKSDSLGHFVTKIVHHNFDNSCTHQFHNK